MGRNHARVYELLEGVRLEGVYDIEIERAKALVAEFGGKAVDSLEALSECCEAVSVTVPTNKHALIGGELLRLGTHILVEKPIASSEEEAEKLVQLAATTGKVLQVGHVERFNPVLRHLEDRLDRPKFIEAHRLSPFPNRSLDIGVVLDLMIHDLEIILHLVNSPLVHIDAVGVPVLTSHEDIANARLRFKNGCIANVTASRISPDRMRKIRVFQENCYLSLDYQEQNGRVFWTDSEGIQVAEVEIDRSEPLLAELNAFVDAVRGREGPAVSGSQGAAALEAALRITRMIHDGEQ